MPLYETYATREDLAQYLFITEDKLPNDTDKWLARASELVKQMTMNNLDVYNERHLEAVCKAVCAQVEYWINNGETKNISGAVKSYSLGDLSITFDESKDTGYLCIRAAGFLSNTGLLYRGL